MRIIDGPCASTTSAISSIGIWPWPPGSGRSTRRSADEVLAVVARVADVDAVALAPLDRRGLVVAADRGHDHHVRVVHREAVARELLALQHEVEEEAARDALGVDAARPRRPS